jgi:hypothetical protein
LIGLQAHQKIFILPGKCLLTIGMPEPRINPKLLAILAARAGRKYAQVYAALGFTYVFNYQSCANKDDVRRLARGADRAGLPH